MDQSTKTTIVLYIVCTLLMSCVGGLIWWKDAFSKLFHASSNDYSKLSMKIGSFIICVSFVWLYLQIRELL